MWTRAAKDRMSRSIKEAIRRRAPKRECHFSSSFKYVLDSLVVLDLIVGLKMSSRFAGKVYVRRLIFSRKAGILNSNGFLPKISVKAGGRDQEVEGSDHVLGVPRISTPLYPLGFLKRLSVSHYNIRVRENTDNELLLCTHSRAPDKRPHGHSQVRCCLVQGQRYPLGFQTVGEREISERQKGE